MIKIYYFSKIKEKLKAPNNNKKLSTPAIIGISVGAFVLAAVVVVVLIAKLACKKKIELFFFFRFAIC